MINLRDSLTLARTKLKTRKLRTIMTVIVASLMFSVLIGAAFIYTGFNNTLTKFVNQGLNNRIILQAHTEQFVDYEYYNQASTKERAKQILADQIKIRANRAKELDLPFDKQSETALLNPFVQETNELNMNPSNPVIKQLKEEKELAKPSIVPEKILNLDNLKRLSKNFNPRGYYVFQQLETGSNGTMQSVNEQGDYPSISSSKVDQSNQGEKVISPAEKEKQVITYANVIPTDVIKAYMFSNSNWKPESGNIPLVLSTNQAESFLGLKKLAENKPDASLARIQEIRQKSNGLIIKQCYRNNLAQEQIAAAYDYETNKKKTDYVKPDIIYAPPANSSCQPASVLSDTRSKEQKKIDNNLLQYNYEFNQQDKEPIVKEITFEVVGLSPAEFGTFNNGGLISNVLSVMLGMPNFRFSIPETQLSETAGHETFQSIFKVPSNFELEEYSKSHYVEFTSLEDAKKFKAETDCYAWIQTNKPKDVNTYPRQCPAEAPFSYSSFGNNRLEVEEIKNNFLTFLKYGLLVTSTIATIIMSFTVGRMISDSRRESAVFRAIGFKRFDISAIYGFFTFIICLLITIVASAIGIGGAYYINNLFEDDFTLYSLLASNSSDMSIKASLFGFHPTYVAVVIGAIFLVGLISIIIPLIRNSRRNPIKDMRDEA